MSQLIALFCDIDDVCAEYEPSPQPLLSVLMLVTQTWREIVTMLPRFRVVSVSMKGLQIGLARIAAISVEMIHLNTGGCFRKIPHTCVAQKNFPHHLADMAVSTGWSTQG